MNELRQVIGTIIDLASQIIDELDDETMTALTELINAVSQKLGQGPTGGADVVPEPPIEPAMPSSNVEGFAYDDKTGKLMVRFLGEHPNREGPVYSYGGVPKVIFDLFRSGSIPARTNGQNRWGKWWKGKTPSMGASLYTLIKQGGYPYQKVS